MNSRIKKIFGLIDAPNKESDVAINRLFLLLQKGGHKFSDFYTFREKVGTPSEPNLSKSEIEEVMDLQVEVHELRESIRELQQETVERRTQMERLALEEARLLKREHDAQSAYNDVEAIYAKAIKVKKPYKKENRQLDLIKDSDEYKKIMSLPLLVLAPFLNIGDKNPKFKKSLDQFDLGNSNSKQTMFALRNYLRSKDLKFSDIFKHKNEITDPQKLINDFTDLNQQGDDFTEYREQIEALYLHAETVTEVLRGSVQELEKDLQETVAKLDKVKPKAAQQFNSRVTVPKGGNGKAKWSRKKTISCAFGAACAFIVGVGYIIEPNASIVNVVSPKGSIFAPEPAATKRSRYNKKQSIKNENYYEEFYVSYEPVSLWLNVVNGVGTKKTTNLHLGDKVLVKEITNMKGAYSDNKWINVKTSSGNIGYVLGKQLSSEKPSGTSKNDQEKTEFYRKKMTNAYVCAGKTASVFHHGAMRSIDDSKPIKAEVLYYSVNGGRDTKLKLAVHSMPLMSVYNAVIQFSDSSRKYTNYSDISLTRTSCLQELLVTGLQP